MDALNIFLVDNDQYNLNLYRQYLGSQGYDEVSIFNNSTEYTIYMDHRPNVVFLGNNLGQKLGLELLKSFKSVDPEIEVILLPDASHTTNGDMDSYVLDYMTGVLSRIRVINKSFGRNA
ncbi:MAG: response regulator [Bacteroidota bacterium]